MAVGILKGRPFRAERRIEDQVILLGRNANLLEVDNAPWRVSRQKGFEVTTWAQSWH